MRKVLFGLGGVALIGAAVALILIVVVGVNSSGSASRTVTQQDSAPAGDSAVNASQPADAPGGTQEGIAVHGHWTIEVHGQDGALVQRQEFENALTNTGRAILVSLLSRNVGMPAWGILLTSSGTKPCVHDSLPADCVIWESQASNMLSLWGSATMFTTMSVTPSSLDMSLSTLTLQGTAIAGANGTIDQVSSLICVSIPASLDPSVCNNGVVFTDKTLGSPIAVSTGQQILVTVAISFS